MDFRNPGREYAEREAAGWRLQVETELLDRDPELARRALERLARTLELVGTLLPPAACEKLRALPIFLLYGERSRNGGYDNGAEYFQRDAPKHFARVDPRWGSALVIYSASNYVWLSDLWAVKVVVHELAHAQQLETWPERQPEILAAWELARTLGLYEDVVEVDGSALDVAYATTNQLEYFAEISCAYFCGCNYFPFTREDLLSYDPDGYRVVEAIWGVSSGPGADPGADASSATPSRRTRRARGPLDEAGR